MKILKHKKIQQDFVLVVHIENLNCFDGAYREAQFEFEFSVSVSVSKN